MYWTEKEARQKVCPFLPALKMRIQALDGKSSSEGPATPASCLGSRCMMWRQATFFKNTKTGEAPIKPGLHEAGTAAECGYCGLAGHPNPMFVLDAEEPRE